MKHDHKRFDASHAYRASIADRVTRFLPMVRRLAWHLHGSGRSEFDLDDLMQAGLVALTECAQRHEGPGEDGFAAYAKTRVRGAMVDLIRRNAAGSRGATARRRRIEGAELALRNLLGREPLPAEMAAQLEMTIDEYEALREAAQPISLEPIDQVYSESDAHFRDPGPDGLEVLMAGELREALIDRIGALPERLQLVIQLYFAEELSLSDIAQVIGVSIPRVHQLKTRALELLREGLSDLVEVR